ncbi:MAG: hypothetical protein AB8G99_06825 [Planctomycetaceae bacterium]
MSLAGLSCLVSLLVPMNQEAPESTERLGFERARASLPRLAAFKLDDQGRLRLDRESWDEEPPGDAVVKDDEPPQNAGGVARGNAPTAIDKVLNRIKIATGTWTRGTTSSRELRSSTFAGKHLQGQYVVTPTDVMIELEELQGSSRTLQVLDSDKATRFLVYSASGCIQILRCESGVHVASVIDGEVESFTGASFVEVVRNQPAYFNNVLQPALAELANLPLDAVAETDLPSSDPPSFGETKGQIGQSLLQSPDVVDALSPLAQFRLVNRRLVFNRAYGPKGQIDDKVQQVHRELQSVVDEAVAELKNADLPSMQIGDFKRQLRVGPRVVEGRFSNVEQEMFFDLRHTMKCSSDSGSWGGANFEHSFRSGLNSKQRVSGRIKKNRDLNSLNVTANGEAVRLVVSKGYSVISLRSPTELTSIYQTTNPERCTLLQIAPTGSNAYSGPTFVSLIRNMPDDIWERERLRFSNYGIGGLDIFADEIVQDISKRLKQDLPATYDPKEATTATETVVLPLMNDAQYLQAIQGHVAKDATQLLKKRVIQLRRNGVKSD